MGLHGGTPGSFVAAKHSLGGERILIAALVLFSVPRETTLAQMTEAFEQSAPRFSGMPGLLAKHYLFDGNDRGGAFYLWSSREHANAVFDENWKESLKQRYGSPPSLSIFEVPVTVLNPKEIDKDQQASITQLASDEF